MDRFLLLAYYPVMGLLVFLNTRIEARFGVSRSTKAIEAVLAFAIIAPLLLPLLLDLTVALGVWR
jgi:hypothetical protein